MTALKALSDIGTHKVFSKSSQHFYALDAANTRCKDDAALFLVGDQVIHVIFFRSSYKTKRYKHILRDGYGFHIRHTEIDHLILYFPMGNDGAVQITRCIRLQF